MVKKMAESPTNIENQIDSFLEQFKQITPETIKEPHHKNSLNIANIISHSCISNLDIQTPETGKTLGFCINFNKTSVFSLTLLMHVFCSLKPFASKFNFHFKY
jgi:hypothetical protein